MGISVGVTKLAGKVRSVFPKNITGAVTTDNNKWDYRDGTAQSNIDRGQDPTYAMARDAVNSDLRWLGSPLARLTGDEFISATESQINLLSDLTALVGAGPLTNNNAVTFANDTSDDESPIWNNKVAQFASASSQYLSVPTASAVQVGTNSYQTGIAFKTSTTGVLQMMFSYGSHVVAKAYWELGINSSNQIFFAQWDATNTDTLTDTIPNRWQDGRWHIATIDIDRTSLKLVLKVDGVFIGSITVTATGTLTIAGENLYIGANKSSGASIVNFWNGSLALFKLINNAVDYNVPIVWNAGIREAVSTAGTTLPPTNDSTQRLNNNFRWSGAQNDYSYAAFWAEDGEYEIQESYLKNTNAGISQLIIDGNIISTVDRYNGSLTQNNITKTYGIKLTAGLHIIKYLTNTKNASSSGYICNNNFINFIKRRGHENGGVDNFLLLGDEISERQSNLLSFSTDNNTYYNSILTQATSPANGDYFEGTLFIKGGLYRIDYDQTQFSDCGMVDMWVGNVQVFAQLDGYNAGVVHNNITTRYVRLQQGKNNIRLAINGKNGSSSGFKFDMNNIRGLRLSD